MSAPLRVVLDTNVLVSALLKPSSVPGRALAAFWARGGCALYDTRIAREYRDVLYRPKLKAIDRGSIEAFFALLAAHGRELSHAAAWPFPLPDDDDRIFVEVAISGGADAIVTGNLRDYPPELPVAVHPPATLLAMLEAAG